MKKIKKFLSGKVKLIVAFVFGLVVTSTLVYATTILYSSDEVSYDNSLSGLVSTNVQGAIDELFTKANLCGSTSGDSIYTPISYGFDYIDEYTSASEVPHQVFLVKYRGLRKYGVCIEGGDCFRYNNYDEEKIHIQKVFENLGGSCEFYSTSIACSYSSTYCEIYSDGEVNCEYMSDVEERCRVSYYGDYGNGCEFAGPAEQCFDIDSCHLCDSDFDGIEDTEEYCEGYDDEDGNSYTCGYDFDLSCRKCDMNGDGNIEDEECM